MSWSVSTPAEFRTGTVAIVGRPNVGKSTLLNRLIGQKLSITSRKPQTTRQRITGILTLADAQLLFVDTPGFQTRHAGALNRGMNRAVAGVLAEVDVALLVVEAPRFDLQDQTVLNLIPGRCPLLLAVNKIDRITPRAALLPYLQEVAARHPFAEVVPVSAAKGHGVPELAAAVSRYLPVGPAIHGADEITESSERFLASELIREKLFRSLGEELPYSCAVLIDQFAVEGGLRRIHASILVDKESHKGMVVGAAGARLKEVGSQARKDMEKMFGGKVHLEMWVRVQRGWSENRQTLKRLGYV